MYGNSFLRCVLECIYVWNLWFPGSSFEETYLVLVDMQVKFPKKFSYFKAEEIESFKKGSHIKSKIDQETNNLNESKSEKNHKEKNLKATPTPMGKNNELEKFMEDLQQYLQYFEALQINLNFFLSNGEENQVKEEMKELMLNFTQLKGFYQTSCQQISDFNNQELEEQYLSKLLSDLEFMDIVISEYGKYTSGKITYKEFRSEFSTFEEHDKENPFEETKKGDENSFVGVKQLTKNSNNIDDIQSINSISTMKPLITDVFDATSFQKEVLSNIKSFNDNRKKYLEIARSDNR